MTDKILKVINSILSEQLNINSAIRENTHILEIGLDSIGIMILLVYLENAFEMEIDIEPIFEKEYEAIQISDIIDSVIRGINHEKE